MSELVELDVLQMPSAPALPAAAVARLPRGELGVPELDEDPFWRLVAAFLVDCRRPQTRARVPHRSEGLVCLVRRHDVALWARQLGEQPQTAGRGTHAVSACGA